MTGETNLSTLLKSLQPALNEGEFVFCTLTDSSHINMDEVLACFKEKEGLSVVMRKEIADQLNLSYPYVASWITLTVQSSLEAVGLTAAVSRTLAEENISCNVIAAFYHDHVFVATKDKEKAMRVLNHISGEHLC